MSMQQRKTIQSWQAPFRTEDDVTRSFVVNVDKLIASVADLESKLGRQIEDLRCIRSAAGEHRRARGTADCLLAIRAIEKQPARRQRIQTRRLTGEP